MSATKPPPGYVSLRGAAEMSGYATETVRIAAVAGELKGVRKGGERGQWVFKPSDVRAWLGIDEPAESVA